jgi:mycofactocin precursor
MALTEREVPSLIEDDDTPHDEELVEDELLVEEVSIDGMCGVY